MPARVAWITYAPVKGLGLVPPGRDRARADGVRENRRFYLISEDGRLVNGKVAGALVQVVADADPDGTTLSLRFPDGRDRRRPGRARRDAVETNFYGRPVAGRIVEGPWSQRALRLRGPAAPARARRRAGRRVRPRRRGERLARQYRVARAARGRGRRRSSGRRTPVPDALRDRRGRRARRGRLARPPGRRRRGRAALHASSSAAAPSRPRIPDTGDPGPRHAAADPRTTAGATSEEPLPFGVWGGVEQPGRVRVGDRVAVIDS